MFLSGRSQLKQIYEADQFAFNLNKDYPEILKKFLDIRSRELPKYHRLFEIISMLTWAAPHPGKGVRLKKLSPLQKEKVCPNCKRKIGTETWCPYCYFKVLGDFPYANFAIVLSGVCLLLSFIPIVFHNTLSFELERDIGTMFLINFIIFALLALMTSWFFFREIFARKPNFIAVTILFGVILFAVVFLSTGLVMTLNPPNMEEISRIIISSIVIYLFGGFALFYLILDNRFKNADVQWSIPRCPRCTLVISETVPTCPSCKQVIGRTQDINYVQSPTPSIPESFAIAGSEVRFCINCGKERIKAGAYCIACGTRFPVLSEGKESSSEEE
jgi:hypothetical protein